MHTIPSFLFFVNHILRSFCENIPEFGLYDNKKAAHPGGFFEEGENMKRNLYVNPLSRNL